MIEILITIALFLIVISVLIIVHEFGHFIIARKRGVRVERFSIGFPPYIYRKQLGDTEYTVGAILLGGFVKLHGENVRKGEIPDEDSFAAKGAISRLFIVLSGIAFNFLFAWALLFIVMLLGFTTYGNPSTHPISQDVRIVDVTNVGNQSILQRGDIVNSVQKFGLVHEVTNSKDVSEIIGKNAGSVIINITRDEVTQDVSLNIIEGEGVGISVADAYFNKPPVILTPAISLLKTLEITGITITTIIDFGVDLVKGTARDNVVTGPIGIAGYITQFATEGIGLFSLLSLSNIYQPCCH